MFSDVLSCFPMFSAVFRCSQLFCDIFSWVITFMDNHTSVRCITNPCTRMLLSSLYEVGNLWQDQDASVGNQIGPNWTKFDHVGTTGGNWETISGSFSISFRSKLEVQSQCAPLLSPSGDLGIGLV